MQREELLLEGRSSRGHAALHRPSTVSSRLPAVRPLPRLALSALSLAALLCLLPHGLLCGQAAFRVAFTPRLGAADT